MKQNEKEASCQLCGSRFQYEFSLKGGRERRYCDSCRGRSYYEIYKEKGKKNNPLNHSRAAMKWQKENKLKSQIARRSRSNKKSLIILRECDCEYERTKHLHHPDYEKPNEVMILCPSCHRKEHKANQAQA